MARDWRIFFKADLGDIIARDWRIFFKSTSSKHSCLICKAFERFVVFVFDLKEIFCAERKKYNIAFDDA